jgi:hypothetical protein
VKRRDFVVGLTLVAACGGKTEAPVKKETGPDWGDVWTSTPEIYAVIRPQALKNDKVFGSFWRALLRAAQARGFARGATMTEVLEGAQEIVVGVNRTEAAIVLRGVPASLDPAKMQSDDGKPLFRLASDPRNKVLEYTPNDPKLADGGVFVLPDRTWVGALGAARDRARGAFAAPEHRPHVDVSANALTVLRLSGGFLRLFEKHRTFGPLMNKLSSVTFELEPGNGGAVIGLAYSESAATAYGEMQAKKIAADLAGNDKNRAWIKDAKIQYEGDVVYVRLALPPRLLDELPNVTGSDLGI